MQKLDGCVISTAVDIEIIKEQIRGNLKLGTTNVSEAPFFREGKSIAIVGGGPSLKNYLEELRAFKGPVMACGSVHDYLIANDIAIEYCVLCDPDPLITQYLKNKTEKGCKYLVASQCHSEIFEYLKSFDTSYYATPYDWDENNTNPIYIWHAGGDKFNNAEIFGEKETIIGGGCTVGTRAIVLAMSFGYNNISLFGFDSSLSKDFKHHSYDFQTDKETIGNITEIRLGGPDDPNVFHCADYMVGQLFDVKKLLEIYGSRVKFDIRCDGALRYLFDLAIEMNKRKE